jgi:electron transfer flavoprotein alpha subunit
MSIFVYTENISGAYKKAALEAVSYAKTVADMSGTDVVAVSINPTDAADVLYKYGASKVVTLKSDALKSFNPKAYAEALATVVDGVVDFPQPLGPSKDTSSPFSTSRFKPFKICFFLS